MYSNAVRRVVTQVLHPSQGSKIIAVAAIHTSPTKNDALGEWVQHLRFRYYHDPRHHLDNDRHAKVFAVEGNMKSGKGEFAKEFAERLDLRFFPSCDYSYIITAKERYFDPEERDFLMDENHIFKRSLDVAMERVYTNPEDWAQMARYQQAILKAKFYQYADAVAHLIRTGQGVVIEKSYFSMPIFEVAFKKMKWQNREVMKYLHDYRLFMQQRFLPPQVVIYLDVPAEDCYTELQKNGSPAEKQISLKYLQAMEEGYSKYLIDAERYGSKVITLDWTKDRDVEAFVMDMEEMESLQLPHCRWDQGNGELKEMMRDFQNNFMLQKMSFLTCPIEELTLPHWMYFASPIYASSRPWYKTGYKNDKWAWLREPTCKTSGYLA